MAGTGDYMDSFGDGVRGLFKETAAQQHLGVIICKLCLVFALDAAVTPQTALAQFVCVGNGDGATVGEGVPTNTASGGGANAGLNSVACGTSANANGTSSAAFGFAAGSATGDSNSAFGTAAGNAVDGSNNVAFGVETGQSVNGSYNVAIGDAAGRGLVFNPLVTNGTVAVGAGDFINLGSGFVDTAAKASGISGTAVGGATFDSNGNIVGQGAQAIGNYSSAFGTGSVAQGDSSTAIGTGAFAAGAGDVAVGQGARVEADNSSAFGAGATVLAGHTNSTAIGAGATTTRANQVMLGTSSNSYTMPGLTSNHSKSVQGKPTHLVTSNAGGDLAAYTPSELGLATSGDLAAVQSDIDALGRRDEKLAEGLAAVAALAQPIILPGQTFAMRAGWGGFDHASAVSFTAAGVLAKNLVRPGYGTVVVDGGVGVGTDEGEVAGRAGLTFGW